MNFYANIRVPLDSSNAHEAVQVCEVFITCAVRKTHWYVQYDVLANCLSHTTHHPHADCRLPLSVSLATNVFVFIVTSSEIRSLRLLAITRRAPSSRNLEEQESSSRDP